MKKAHRITREFVKELRDYMFNGGNAVGKTTAVHEWMKRNKKG